MNRAPKFCVECGQGLPPGAKFCPACGTRAALPEASDPPPPEPPVEPPTPRVPEAIREKYEQARAELRGERRQVAVLFADVKGYTSLSESLDPEEVSFFMHGLLRELGDVVFQYEGHVDKFIGDAVMALFGAPIAHENDAERAVLAGLEMLEVVRRHDERADFEIALRVGINLGEVVAGHVGSGDHAHYTVMGDAVNVASRLEGAAGPGTVLVSEGVHRRIADRFESEEGPPLTLKGKSEPVRAWRIVAYRPSATRRTASATAFVGREEELAAAVAWFERVADGEAGVLAVEAEAGAGKSRLVSEARRRIDDRVRTLEVAFEPTRRPGAVPAPAEVFRDLIPGARSDELEAALDLLGERVDEHRPGVLGLALEANPNTELEAPPETDPETARRNRWLALVALLEAAARERPVAVVFDDVHWADESAREFLAFLLAGLPTGVGVTVLGRPPLEIVDEEGGAERIRLRPLGEADVRAILGPLWYEMRPAHREALVRRSQGNPLFLEELVRAVEAGDGDPSRVPDSLEALIRSRIDRLPPPVQTVVQMAAVLGPRFPEHLLDRMWELEPHPITFGAAMAALEEAGFVTPVEDGERRFLHPLSQEVAYRGLLHRVRRILHESAARIGEDAFADRMEAEAPFFAHHYWAADLRREAAPHLWIAGRAASEAFDLASAESFLRRAAEAIASEPDVLDDVETRADFMATIGSVLLHRGELDDAEAWFGRLESAGVDADRPEWRVSAMENRGRIAWYRGDLDAAADLFEAGLGELSDETASLAADLHNDLGIVWLYRGDPARAEQHHRQALEIRERRDDRQGRAKSHLNLGNVRVDLAEDLDGGREHYERALELAEEVGDRQLRSMALGNLGRIAMELGEWEDAIDRFRGAHERASEIGWTYGRFVFLQNRAYCELGAGRLEGAVRRLEACREQGEGVLEPVNRVNTRHFLFYAWHRALADDRAEEMAREARELVESLGVEEMEDAMRLIEGRVAAARGEWDEAARAFADAAEAARRLSHPEPEKVARAHRDRALARLGRPREAEDAALAPEGSPPTRALLRYLLADADASRDPSPDAARALEEAGRRAVEDVSDRWIERAAFARAAATWTAIGEPERAERAEARASDATRALAEKMPEQIRDGFLAHPRGRIESGLPGT